MLATDSIEVHDTCYLVRVGSMGRIGRFQVVMAAPLNRRERVVCRTSRGLEVGNILGPAQMAFDEAWPSSEAPGRRASMEFDGRIIRKLTAEDELLWKQLQLLGSAAYSACEAWLVDHAIQTTLLEVEPLLDGRTLYFHFLNEVTAEVQSHLDELVAIYEAQVRQSKFAQLLEHGCGPGCGTEKALNGCGTRGGCAVCSIAAQCKSSDKSNRSH